MRTQTLVKNAVIQIDAAPFKQWYQQHYGVEAGQKKRAAVVEEVNCAASPKPCQSSHLRWVPLPRLSANAAVFRERLAAIGCKSACSGDVHSGNATLPRAEACACETQ